MARVLVLVATRKGAWFYRGDAARRAWRVDGPHFLGHVLNHVVLDPRDRRTLLAAAKTGHLGPTVFRSTDFGRSWKEASRPPAFPKGDGRAVDHTFWLTPGHASEPGSWYAVRAYYFNGPWSGTGYSYAGWADYAKRNGIACVPGTAIKGAEVAEFPRNRRHHCASNWRSRRPGSAHQGRTSPSSAR